MPSCVALDRYVTKRFLEKREPKLSENIKSAMLIKGGNANSTVTQVLRDVNMFCFESYKLCFTVCTEETVWHSV
uniref:Uncharacterized protein n=1 Tax=Capra hircus TaxID=9925 RepID=A0A8C2RE90_CAPHI